MNNLLEAEKLLKNMNVKSKVNSNEQIEVVMNCFDKINEFRLDNYSLEKIYLALKNSNCLKLSDGGDISQSSFNHYYYKIVATTNDLVIKFSSGRPKGSKTKNKKITTINTKNDNMQTNINNLSPQLKSEYRRSIAQTLREENSKQIQEENIFGFGKKNK